MNATAFTFMTDKYIRAIGCRKKVMLGKKCVIVLKNSLTPFLHETEEVIKKLFALFITIQFIQLKTKKQNRLIIYQTFFRKTRPCLISDR